MKPWMEKIQTDTIIFAWSISKQYLIDLLNKRIVVGPWPLSFPKYTQLLLSSALHNGYAVCANLINNNWASPSELAHQTLQSMSVCPVVSFI